MRRLTKGFFLVEVGTPQWNRHMIFQHLAQSLLDSTWPVYHRTPQSVQFISSGMKRKHDILERSGWLILPQHTNICDTVSIMVFVEFTHPAFVQVPIPLRGSFAFQFRVRGAWLRNLVTFGEGLQIGGVVESGTTRIVRDLEQEIGQYTQKRHLPNDDIFLRL